MQAAALSGMALAEYIDELRGRAGGADVADLAIGLETPFKPSEGEDIGSFPAPEVKAMAG